MASRSHTNYEDADEEEYEMVQTYGIATPGSADPEANRDHDASSPLLGNESTPVSKEDGVATIPSSVGNLANTIIGSGTFSNTFPGMKLMRSRHVDLSPRKSLYIFTR